MMVFFFFMYVVGPYRYLHKGDFNSVLKFKEDCKMEHAYILQVTVTDSLLIYTLKMLRDF